MANVLTRKGRDMITARFIGAPAAGTEFKNVGWGTGIAGVQATAANTDVAPFQELPEARVAGTSSQVTTTTTNDTYQITGTMTASAARAVVEVFLSDTTAVPAGTSTVQATSGVIGSAVGTTVIVGAGLGASYAANDKVQIRTEVVNVSSIATDTLTVARAQNGSAAIATIAAGDTVTRGNAPGQTQVTNGNVAVHADFAVINLASADSIAFTIKGQVS